MPDEDPFPPEGELLVLSRKDIAGLMPMAAAIELMREAMRTALDADARLPLRTVMPTPGWGGFLGLMPGFLPPDRLGVKVLTVSPGNFAHGLSSHRGAVLLFEPAFGRLLAILDAAEITAIRTAAASALATDLLARRDAETLAILGYGEQAARHLEAMLAVRPFKEVRIWGRSAARAQTFIAAERARAGGAQMRVAGSVAAAVAGADVVCAVTAASRPILFGADLSPGAHVNLVGASRPEEREADDAVVTRGRLFVDILASALAQGGEIRSAIAAGRFRAEDIAGQIGEVLLGAVPGRTDSAEITVYKSLGVSAQDLASAAWLVRRARDQGVGARTPF
jgi:ornithine cyclodeaminase